MRKIIVIFGIFIALTCFSEEITMNENNFNVNVISSTDQQTVIEYNFGNFKRIPVKIDGETYYQLSLEKESETYDKGDPELPKITRSIIIPDNAKIKINIIEKDYIDYQMKIVPSKGTLYRDINPADVPYEFSDIYQADDFYPQNLAGSNTPYILRDFRGLTVHAYPFAYNPVTQTLRVYHHLVLEVTNVGIDTENVKIRTSDKINKYFQEIYQNHFINFSTTRYTSVDEHGRMIVICYDSFMSSIQPYVDWKNQKGIDTELYSLSSIGSSASDILNFVQSEYNEGNDLAFVQLVGDAAEIPPGFSSYGDSDPSYSLLEGGDGYPDIFVGRFSAENAAEVDTQVERTIHYERDISSGTWLSKAFGVASDEGTGDDNEYDYEHIDNIRTDLLGYNYTVVDQIYDPGATASQITTAVNEGRSFGTYCGHGSNTSWSTTGFSTTNINTLTNEYMLPFICDVACVNGNFDGLTCFAEAWMRATNGGNPTGAIAIYASTINQSWSPPMSAQDEVADLLCGTGPYAGSGNQKNSIGGLMYNGSCLMLDEYSADDMFQTWTIFGDASLQVRTDTPSTMAISHNANILLGQTSFDVSTGIEGALACLFDGVNIIGSGYTNASGNVALTLDPAPISPGNLTLTVTAYNKTTNVELIPVIAPSGPYVTIESSVVVAGGDDIIEYGETVYLTVTLENVGSDPAINVNMTLSEGDAYITLTDDSESFGTIAAGASVTRTSAYTFTVSNSVPDDYSFQLNGSITCTEDTWTPNINLTAYAPVLSIQNVSVADGDNGRLDPDETADLIVTIENSGGATTNNIDAILSTLDSYVIINDNLDTIGSLLASSTGNVTFNVTAPASTPVGHTVNFNIGMTADLGYSMNDSFSLTVGLVLEDFETGNFTSFPWEHGGNADWSIVTEDPQEGLYCAKSGSIVHNQTSELIITGDVTADGTISFYRKVSSEPNYDFLKFYIDGAEQETWSGEVVWGEVSYPVTAGTRTFKWEYFKDGSVDTGSDCAWVDYIIFPAIYFPEPADITVTPSSFEETLLPSGSTSDILTIGNAGELTLEYTARVSYVETDVVLNNRNNGSNESIVSTDKKAKIHNTFQSNITESNRNRDYATIGAAASTSGSYDTDITPFGTYYHDGQNQYLFTASELSAAGLVAGDINGVGWNVASAAAQVMNGFNIELKHTTATSVTGFETGFTNCYSGTWTASADWNDISFLTPFTWDGTSNLLVKICFDNTSYTSNSTCYFDTYTAMNGYAYNDNTTGCSDPYEGTIDTRPQTRFDYTPGPTLNWLTLNGGSIVSGSIESGSSDDVITVGFDTVPDGLTDGVYEANITITSNDPDESPYIVLVTMNVDSGGVPEPNILVNPTSLIQELEPDQTDTQSFNITNNGDIGTTLTYSIIWNYTTYRSLDQKSKPKDMSVAEYNKLYSNTRDETWLDVTPISGDCTYYETDPITCDFNSTGLSDGMYTATITISNNAGADEYVYVTLNVDTPGGTTPVNPRAIAEFEKMEGVLVRYPFGVPVSLIAEMSEDVIVTTIVANSSEEATVTSTYTSNGVNLANCNFEYSPTDSYWIRDYGPWWVEDGSDDAAIIDYTYNRPRPNDNNIPGELAAYLSEDIYLMGLEHAGGNYMTDGMGVAASTELVWEENPSLTHPEINQIMEDYLGIQTYHVVPDPNNTYIDHIDCWGKFLDVDKILIREVSAGHPQYDEIEATVEYFEAQTSSYGTPYEIYRVYTPNDEPYTNSLILNDKVIVPTMDTPSEDAAALAVYESAMPGYEVLGFYYSSWESTDAIHCRLRGVADRNMLYVNHIPLSGTIPNTRADYQINATVVPYSGQPVYNDSLLVYYNVNGGAYTSVSMTHQSGNDYQGIIPEQAGGSEITYYIHTADQSGRSADHPFIGASDPHYFMIEGQLDAPINVQIQIVGTEVQLSWDAVSEATKYHVFRSTDPYTGFARITPYPAGIAANSYISTLSVEKYFYYITAE